MPTTDKELVALLKKRNYDGQYDDLIEKAAKGYFHDFKSDLATPKMALAAELEKFPELADIRKAVMDGEYDDEHPNDGDE